MEKDLKKYEKRIEKYIHTALMKLLKNEDSPWIEEIIKLTKIPLVVTINHRYNSSWGAAWADYNGWGKPKVLYIDFSVDLFVEHHTIKFIREIVTHELSHCLDMIIRGFTCHDKFWKELHIHEFKGTGKRLIREKDLRK